MSDVKETEDTLRNMSREEMMSALFAHLVMQNTNMALMFLGKVPNPETGKPLYDVEAARMFIDQLEMIEAKTRGNLSREEEKLLKDSLMHLRLTFVEAVENPPKSEKATPAKEEAGIEAPSGAKAPSQPFQASPEEAADAEARKKFSKKY